MKVSERNKYYYENAYALKLFAKNGYKLPSKTVDKRWFLGYIINLFDELYVITNMTNMVSTK